MTIILGLFVNITDILAFDGTGLMIWVRSLIERLLWARERSVINDSFQEAELHLLAYQAVATHVFWH